MRIHCEPPRPFIFEGFWAQRPYYIRFLGYFDARVVPKLNTPDLIQLRNIECRVARLKLKQTSTVLTIDDLLLELEPDLLRGAPLHVCLNRCGRPGLGG